MSPISAIKALSLLSLLVFSLMKEGNSGNPNFSEGTDTLFIYYEDVDKNFIAKSSKIHPAENGYPADWGRSYNIINKNIHILFSYYNDLPIWSDLVFDFTSVGEEFLKNHDFKDQKWFRTTPKDEIFNTFLGRDKIVYLKEKSRIENGKAIMIDMAWAGLHTTSTFKSLNPADQTRILNTISIELTGKDLNGSNHSQKGTNAGC